MKKDSIILMMMEIEELLKIEKDKEKIKRLKKQYKNLENNLKELN